MYDLIYDFLNDYIFNGNVPSVSYDVGGATLGLNEWLSHTTTIVIMVICVILACLLVRWIWRAVSSAFLLK